MARRDSSVRDDLARERTALANQRTLLAYGRTALGLLATALLIFRFGSPDVAPILGPLVLTAALFVMGWGILSFRHASARLSGNTRRRYSVLRPFRILNRLGLALRRHTDDID